MAKEARILPMGVEYSRRLFGRIRVSGWTEVKPGTFIKSLTAEDLTDKILRGQKQFIESIQIGHGYAVVLSVLNRDEETGTYHRTIHAYSPHDLHHLNDRIRSGLVGFSFRNHAPAVKKPL